ncbi:LysR substrate-binding domain-containing protein [Paraburkholderia kirstenboschensis]|uniref:LysR substrate-binding domain-containing protein n=1 Tax=Paraburkholderia kirstenboschensis TaxID=1245436 RepID=A0ABZ0EQV1_9BURK|nr:LysR substrate-binding domain-containing protein [Paraburkholderia kirstenboschensis]WOD19085.1 LysR substrate-binding domain-containing protein [Paraburkholderia kirstenboschensis]
MTHAQPSSDGCVEPPEVITALKDLYIVSSALAQRGAYAQNILEAQWRTMAQRAQEAKIRPEDLVGETFIIASNKARVLHDVIERYLQQSGVDITPDHGVDNLAMAMSLVASTRGLALMPEYANNLLPWSVVSRPLEGDAPTVDLVIGYSRSNTSPVLKLFLSRAEELSAPFTTRSS